MTDVFDIGALFADETKPYRPTPEPPGYFDRDGLDIVRLMADVKRKGPVARGTDGRLWHYESGVWLPGGNHEVGRRVVELLGKRFRKAHLTNVITVLETEHTRVTAEPHTKYINLVNGMLRWHDAELEMHRPDLYSTVQLPILWNPEATCPAIDEWMLEVLPHDSHAFIDELLGYLVLNGNPFHLAVLLLGSGRNGKGTFLRLVTKMLGAANVASTPLQTLAENRFAAASLYGKLANICGDLDSRMLDRSDTFKMATGGDTIYAEHKYGASFAFEPWATMLFSANQAPPAKDTSEGYYARWLVVPFSTNLAGRLRPQTELDPQLHCQSELDGLFARAILGLQRLMARGCFDRPASVLAAQNEFRRSTDPVASFASDCLKVGDSLAVARTEVYERYKVWCDDNGHRSMAASEFYARVVALPGVCHKTRRGTRTLVGVGIGTDW